MGEFIKLTLFSISEGLKAGDLVITERNLNLGHYAKVNLLKEK